MTRKKRCTTYMLYESDPDVIFGSIWLIDKEKLPTNWDGIIIVSNRTNYDNELVHVRKVTILKNGTLEIDPEEYGKMEYERIKETCNYIYHAGESLMNDLLKQL